MKEALRGLGAQHAGPRATDDARQHGVGPAEVAECGGQIEGKLAGGRAKMARSRGSHA